ncbi:MAG: tRNA (N6-isopentenyl adenosine(37)-C2)-methylthiotransferase MiaB [Clostridia bacterium]|nr:tRNA (N6-isopentenyl adenosine(37)-C2)-methylthiotransferase MiaB [Clostridia bacterium]
MDENTRKYYIETYGCQMNVRDSELMAGVLRKEGYTAASSPEEADLILFNTCCVRDHAEKRLMGNIGALKELKDEKPSTVIGVCGCMMQQKEVSDRFFRRFRHVDLVMGTNSIASLPDYLMRISAGYRVNAVTGINEDVVEGIPSVRNLSHSAFVNIMYGCNNFCTYCIVPYVRGRERSRRSEDILREIRSLADAGYTEITLLGQNVNSYGNTNGDIRFPELLARVNGVDGLKRIRFMTSHPKDLSDRLIDAMAENSRVCNHVHLPMQSGSDRILKKMNRHYDLNRYTSIVDRLRSTVKDVEITTDIIVGFPGETEEDFTDTMAAVERIGFASAFTFKYSPRPGTAAAGMEDQIPEAVKAERLKRLNALQNRKTKENNEKYAGYTGEVLIEGFDSKNSSVAFGKYTNFKMVYFDREGAEIGQYRTVTADTVRNNSLRGHIQHDND